ncbi:hypothetical protein [Raoultella lignicola]|uniref:Uncharacterized protein n=1 Tax=Raoultella lignicola TaxID=3040939 RepID=A0ABU9FBH7_9ENTR
MNLKGRYLSTLRGMISFFFIAVPFNPYIGGVTLYLWFFLVFLDYDFLRKLAKVNTRSLLIICMWIFVSLLCGDILLTCKIIMLTLGVTYLVMIGDSILSKIRWAFLISCFWCIAQFGFFYVDPTISYFMGPSELSKAIWGAFATPSYTNQFVVILLPRMSGLSREAGFFASLLAIMFLIRLRDKNMKPWEFIVYVLSYLFSLSKISFSLILVFFLYPLKNIINKIPAILTLTVVCSLSILIALYLNIGSPEFYHASESIAHRLSSSYLVINMYPSNLLLGCGDSLQCYYPEATKSLIDGFLNAKGFEPTTGLNGVVISLGVLGFLCLIITIVVLKLQSFDVLIIALITSTVTQFTIDGFVILTYYYVLTNKYYTFPIFKSSKI